MALSIRWRLTLWNTLALAVLLVGFSALVYALLVGDHYEQVDRALLAECEEMRQDERLQSEPDQRLSHWVGELQEDKQLCVVYDERGKVFLKTPELADESVPAAPGEATEAPRYFDRTLPVIGRQRVLTWRLRAGERGFTVLQMNSLAHVDDELRQVLLVLCLAVPLTLLASGGMAYWLALKALQPMDQLHRRTAEITAERLDRRLPVLNPGDELGRLAQTINGMIARLERSFAEIRRFTADASHELRTPLTAIRTEAEVALKKPLTTAEHRNLLGSILEECDRLTRLTEQLLDLAREDAKAGPGPLPSLDLAALVAGVVEVMRPLAEAKGLDLRWQGGAAFKVHGDETRLRQVFYNLLDNAIKYTPEKGVIEIRLDAGDRSAIVSVRDTGVGIPPEHLPRVFDRFYRVDKARARAQGGTGLGLSIARAVVLAHGGRIELFSEPGRGTTCTVTLPEEPGTNAARNGEP